MVGMIPHDGQTNLPEIVSAVDSPARLPGRLDGGEQQGHKNSDNGDHHQEFHECKTVSRLCALPAIE
jgi:hypothetical protein